MSNSDEIVVTAIAAFAGLVLLGLLIDWVIRKLSGLD